MEQSQDMNELLFTGLVLSFQQSAMIGLGKIMNPVSGKIEKSLDQAKYSIDVLGMFQKKTAGNLTEAESAMLQQTLTMLRLNYVEEVKADKESEKDGGDEKQEAREPAVREGKEEEEVSEKKAEKISGEKEERSGQKPKKSKKKKSGKNT